MKSARFPRLSTKFAPGTLPPYHIARAPLGLDSGSLSRVVLVRAPAGFGKTTAMIECFRRIEEQGAAVAWITLDSLDNDVTRFAHYLGELLQQIGLYSVPPKNPVELLQALQEHSSIFTLFMDDVDALRHEAALELLKELIHHLPRGGQVVLGSRSWPNLGLGRLRARGHLIEVGPPQLRFTLDESRNFLRKRDALLPEHILVSLHARCEGWPTGLSLASLAIARHPHAAALAENFSGSDQALAEYLAEDVLNNLPGPMREFLVRTSILKQLTVPVCDALCPEADCHAMLDQLTSQGMFMSRVGDSPPTWTYHKLFASFLRSRLALQGPEAIATLHGKASIAYEQAERPVPAIDHAVMAHDSARAVALLVAHGESFVEQGRLRLLNRWFSVIGDAALLEHSKLRQLALWAVCLTQGPAETLKLLDEHAGTHADHDTDGSRQLSLQAMILALQDRYDDAYRVGKQALQTLPSDLPFADSALINLMANLSSIHGQFPEARKLLDTARTRYGASAFNRMFAESLEGMLDMQEGRMRQATARFRLAVETTQNPSPYQTHGNAWAGVLHAYAQYEANETARSEHLLNIYLPMVREVGLPDHMILSFVLRTRLSFLSGDVDHAIQTLIELEHLGHLRQLPRVVSAARLERSRLFMLQGNTRAAFEELERASHTPVWNAFQHFHLIAHDLDYPALAKIRWQASLGNGRTAIQDASQEIQHAEQSGRYRRALKLRLLQTIAQLRLGQDAIALPQIEALLRTCCQEGYVRIVLDESPWINPLLQRFYAKVRDGRHYTADPVFEDFMHRLMSAAEISLEAESDTTADELPNEPLTRKELHVLQLLAEGYSNSAIAEKLVVADTTVRTHLRHINAKLNANSRTQAVARARKLRLIL